MSSSAMPFMPKGTVLAFCVFCNTESGSVHACSLMELDLHKVVLASFLQHVLQDKLLQHADPSFSPRGRSVANGNLERSGELQLPDGDDLLGMTAHTPAGVSQVIPRLIHLSE